MEWVFLEETDSTNRVAKELARQGAPHGTAVLAKKQTAGRGRLGRNFFSPEGGLYLSVILRPQCPVEDRALITPMAAVAVHRVLMEDLGIVTRIKWVNDLYIGEKKLGGILCEGCGDAVIVGIGLNLYTPEGGFPADIPAIALDLMPCLVDVRELAADIRKYLLEPGPFLQEYRSLCLTVGKTVTVHPVRGEPYEARALEIDHRCRLVVESRRGVETLDSGEVSVRF